MSIKTSDPRELNDRDGPLACPIGRTQADLIWVPPPRPGCSVVCCVLFVLYTLQSTVLVTDWYRPTLSGPGLYFTNEKKTVVGFFGIILSDPDTLWNEFWVWGSSIFDTIDIQRRYRFQYWGTLGIPPVRDLVMAWTSHNQFMNLMCNLGQMVQNY